MSCLKDMHPWVATSIITRRSSSSDVPYKDAEGRTVSFYIRPKGEGTKTLQRGSRLDGELEADYWSDGGYNYAMIGPAGDSATKAARLAL